LRGKKVVISVEKKTKKERPFVRTIPKPKVKKIDLRYQKLAPTPFSVRIKFDFCCEEGKKKAKVVATNHVARLWSCDGVKKVHGGRRCPDKIVKLFY
jgi:hypothetical protein